MEQLERTQARVRARFVGSRLNLRHFETGKPLAVHPLTIRAGERGVAVLFRFGAAALVDVSPIEEAAFYEALAPFVSEPEERPGASEAEQPAEAAHDRRTGVDVAGDEGSERGRRVVGDDFET